VPPASRPAGAAPRHQRGRVACGAAARGGGGAGTLSSRTRHLKTTSGTASPALAGVEPPRSAMARFGMPVMSAPAGTRPAKEPLSTETQESRARNEAASSKHAARMPATHGPQALREVVVCLVSAVQEECAALTALAVPSDNALTMDTAVARRNMAICAQHKTSGIVGFCPILILYCTYKL